MLRSVVYLVAAVLVLGLPGCGGGGSVSKVATQPNGPPKPPPPPPPRLDSKSNHDKAIDAAVAFAKTKYKTQLEYERTTAGCITKDTATDAAFMPDGTIARPKDIVPAGSWFVRIPMVKGKKAESVDVSTAQNSDEAQGVNSFNVIGRNFVVYPDGKVTEAAPSQGFMAQTASPTP